MIPENRIPTHPVVILLKEFLEPMSLTQVNLAKHIGVPVQKQLTGARKSSAISR